MSFSLRRTRDGAGDSGQMSRAIMPIYNESGFISATTQEDFSEPKVGYFMQVGSHYGRSYSGQDYWQTTVITEILERKVDEDGEATYVRFKTGNSEYEWESF